MQWEFSKRKSKLLVRMLKISWRQETAYFANKIFAAITPLMYVLSFLLFITVLFQNIDSVAGYTKQEMLFLIFIGQLSFYSFSFWGNNSSGYLETYVNNGMFDYILLRPVNSLFFMTWHGIQPLHGLINFVGPLTPSWLIIDWSQLNISINNLPFALIIFLCGVGLFHYVQFCMSLISFWTGKGRQANLVVFAASSQSIPLEGFSSTTRRIFVGVLPVYVSSVVASVLLGKTDPVFWVVVVGALWVFFGATKRILWGLALRRYSSASS